MAVRYAVEIARSFFSPSRRTSHSGTETVAPKIGYRCVADSKLFIPLIRRRRRIRRRRPRSRCSEYRERWQVVGWSIPASTTFVPSLQWRSSQRWWHPVQTAPINRFEMFRDAWNLSSIGVPLLLYFFNFPPAFTFCRGLLSSSVLSVCC